MDVTRRKFFYLSLSYRYLAKIKEKNENNAKPINSSIDAPGQYIILNNTPNDVREKDNAPVINVSFFIAFRL